MTERTGFCECGCGGRTNIYQGVPRRFIMGHQQILPQTWTEEDRGFETPCWIWQGGRSSGYGWSVTGIHAHREVWIQTRGPIPLGLILHHRCRQKDCVNPDHLQLLTQREHTALHPETGRKNRLSKEAVDDIRISPASLKEIAAKYGISKGYAASVRRGFAPREFAVNPADLPARPPTPQKSWNHGRSRLTSEDVHEIRTSTLPRRALAMKFGITGVYVWKIRTGKALAHL